MLHQLHQLHHDMAGYASCCPQAEAEVMQAVAVWPHNAKCMLLPIPMHVAYATLAEAKRP